MKEEKQPENQGLGMLVPKVGYRIADAKLIEQHVIAAE